MTRIAIFSFLGACGYKFVMRPFITFILPVFSVLILGCASTPPALVPSPTHVQGLAVVAQTEAAEQALGGKKTLIIQNTRHQAELFTILEMNKTDAPTSSIDISSHDFVVKWKLRNEKDMDRSQLYLQLGNPKRFVYESDLGGITKKYIIKVPDEDARVVWSVIGVTPAAL